MNKEINIAQVSIKNSDTHFDLISLHQFLKLPITKRHDLIKQQMIEFIDETGGKIKLIDGLRAITDLIKRLREEGTYMDFISAR